MAMMKSDPPAPDHPAQAELHSAYFQTRFYAPQPPESWPNAFAIITAYATTGERWTEARNRTADQALAAALASLPWRCRIIGFSPTTHHAEPGWAVPLDFFIACDLGLRFLQDAIYYIEQDQLFVSKCERHTRQRVFVDTFSARLSQEPPPGLTTL